MQENAMEGGASKIHTESILVEISDQLRADTWGMGATFFCFFFLGCFFLYL